MAIYYFSPVSRRLFISFTSVNNTDFDDRYLIRRVLRPDRHIPASFRKIIFEFRHIIIMCQFMVDAESVRKPEDSIEIDASECDRTQTTGEPPPSFTVLAGVGVPDTAKAYEASTEDSDDIPAIKRRKKVTEKQLQKAVKLVIDEKMTQNVAEKQCELYRGALSSGRGKKLLDAMTAMESQAYKELMTVSDDVGDDFQYN